MFEELGFITVIFIISYVFKRIAFKKELGPFKTILMILRYFGVVIHELSHYIFCILCRVPAGKPSVKLRSKYTGNLDPHGKVSLYNMERISFMQHALASLAPLLVSSWLIYWCIEWTFTEDLNLPLRILAGFSAISLLLGAAPSQPDMMLIQQGFNYDRRYSWFQLFLVGISSLLVFILLEYIQWDFLVIFVIDTLGFLLFLAYYLVIGIIYTALKYSILGMAWLLKALTSTKRPGQSNKSHYSLFRKTIRPAYYGKYKEQEVEY